MIVRDRTRLTDRLPKGLIMTNFTGAPCPVCKKNFTKDDRPVVCPDCGAPYHRACYTEKGECVFSASHGAGFAWKKTPDTAHGAVPKPETEKNFDSSILRETLNRMGFFDAVDKDSEIPSPTPDERFLFGVSEKEFAYFQGGIHPLRLMRYRRIASGNKISLNIFAGLFSPLYLFYSRMRGFGALITFITFLLSLPSWLDTYSVVTNTAPVFTQMQLLQMAANLSFFNLSLKFFIAFFYDYFYLRWAARKIKLIRSRFYPDILDDRPEIPDKPSVSTKLQGLDDEYYDYLQAAGSPGVRFMLMDTLIAVMLTFFLLHLLVGFLGGSM
jgi:uncharacterized Zn finger protein (UPF0148 family)